MKKTAAEIADLVLLKVAARFEGTPEEWKQRNIDRVDKLEKLIPLILGGAGAAGAGLGAATSGGDILGPSIVGGGLGGLISSIPIKKRFREVKEKELRSTTPEQWAQGLEQYNKKYE